MLWQTSRGGRAHHKDEEWLRTHRRKCHRTPLSDAAQESAGRQLSDFSGAGSS